MFPPIRPSFMCGECSHLKRDHFVTKFNPMGPCRNCKCQGFMPEPMCKCGHGKKAHSTGICHEKYKCGCVKFTPKDVIQKSPASNSAPGI